MIVIHHGVHGVSQSKKLKLVKLCELCGEKENINNNI